MLIRIIKNYNDRNYAYYSPNASMQWNGIQFTEEEVKECDGVIIINTLKKKVTLKCPIDNIVAIMQEPYHAGDTDWMDSKLDQFHYVFTNHIPSIIGQNTEIVLSHGALPWHVLKSYDELKVISEPMEKESIISCVASNLTRWPGHKKRIEFIEYLKEYNELGIDFYGKGTKFIEDKWDAIAPYKYSIVIENNNLDHYWTEKISDVYLGYALPFYFGCTNIDEYFPAESYIWIDINNPEEAVLRMRKAIENNEWEKRIDAIIEARRRVLDEYNLLPMFSHFFKMMPTVQRNKKIVLRPYVYPFGVLLKRKLEKYKHRYRNLLKK